MERTITLKEEDYELMLWALQQAQRAQRRDAQDAASGAKPHLCEMNARLNIKWLQALWEDVQLQCEEV